MTKRRILSPLALLSLCPMLLLLAIMASILYGSKHIDASAVRDALFHFDPDQVDHQIIRHSRVPRAIGAAMVGAFLALSGALMQGMTRNDLASPSVLGITDGSAFAVTLCMVFLPNAATLLMVGYSLLGSALSIVLVFGLSMLMPGGMAPVRMAILGTVIGLFLSSLSALVATYFQITQSISFWYNARLHLLNPEMIKIALPFAVIGIALALWLSKSVTLLAMGDDVATGLGQKTRTVKLLGMLSVTLLTGVSVAIAGKIAFIGLVVPHLVRLLTRSTDYRWILPCSALMGALMLVASDLLSRFLNYPFEMPVGVVTAIIGVPFFLYLIRTRGGGRTG